GAAPLLAVIRVAAGLGSWRLRNRQAGGPGRRTREASWMWQGGRVRRLVYVSGAPGAGKSSLAGPLAAELGFTLITKDTLKETLHDALRAPEPDLAWPRRLGGAAMELLWRLAADAPAVVIEANFRPYSEYEREKLSTLAAHPVEV